MTVVMRIFRLNAPSAANAPARATVGAVLAAIVPLLAFAQPATAAQGFFLGDSIADDTAKTVGIPGAARTSTHLRRGAVIPQFARLPKGSVALMSLGLNDAEDGYKPLIGDIERVIEAAEGTGEKFVWIGPPCVGKSWDKRNQQLDAYLGARLASTAIQYVSLRDPNICRGNLRSRDGEHFTEAGYRYVWQKVKRDSTFAAAVEPSPGAIEVVEEPKPQVRKVKKHRAREAYNRGPRRIQAE